MILRPMKIKMKTGKNWKYKMLKKSKTINSSKIRLTMMKNQKVKKKRKKAKKGLKYK